MSAPLAVETSALTKRFRGHAAVEDLDLAVPSGSVFGFLGPNGSGKTTTIRMMLGLLNPTAGEVRLLGLPMPAAQGRVLPRVGALIEGPGFAPYLSGAANLARLDAADRHAAGRDRGARIRTALERVGLSHAAGKKVKAYSLGMKQRLGLAGALLQPRDLLVLDEPTNGLDPQGTREVRHLIRTLADGGTTVFVSSHLLAEIEQICSHAAVLSVGRLVAQGTIAALRHRDGSRVVVLTPDAGLAAEALTGLGLEPEVRRADHGAEVVAGLPEGLGIERIAPALVEAGARVHGLRLDEPTLEERFVALTGEGFDVAS